MPETDADLTSFANELAKFFQCSVRSFKTPQWHFLYKKKWLGLSETHIAKIVWGNWAEKRQVIIILGIDANQFLQNTLALQYLKQKQREFGGIIVKNSDDTLISGNYY